MRGFLRNLECFKVYLKVYNDNVKFKKLKRFYMFWFW